MWFFLSVLLALLQDLIISHNPELFTYLLILPQDIQFLLVPSDSTLQNIHLTTSLPLFKNLQRFPIPKGKSMSNSPTFKALQPLFLSPPPPHARLWGTVHWMKNVLSLDVLSQDCSSWGSWPGLQVENILAPNPGKHWDMTAQNCSSGTLPGP